MKGPPAKNNVADPQPSHGPRYRHPEEAKRLIAEMLQDMEDRQIIEKSTSAWLSLIDLVNMSRPDKFIYYIVFFFFSPCVGLNKG